MEIFRSRFFAFWFCIVLNLGGLDGYARSTVLCLNEEGRHAMEFSADGYRCHSSAAMSQTGFSPSVTGAGTPVEEDCGSCVDTPLSTQSFAVNCSSPRPWASGPAWAVPANVSPAFGTILTPTIEGRLTLLSSAANPSFTSLLSTVLLI